MKNENKTRDSSGRPKDDKTERVWLKLMEFGRRTGCHQMPERSFFIKDMQFPVCARCTGVFIGWLFAVVGIFFYRPGFITIGVFCAPMFIDWFLQYKKILRSNNIRRLITGILGGYALTSLYIILILKLIEALAGLFA